MRLSRRQFTLGALALSGTAALPVFSGTARAATAHDYTARETFDLFDRIFHDSGSAGQPTDTNEHGGLAWGQSYVLAGFIRMYEAYKDTHYLDRLIHNIDLVLAGRDSARGVTDHRGRSLPGWRAMAPYTVGLVTLKDAGGKALVEIRTALTYADNAVATVRAGSSADRFTLEVRNNRTNLVATFTDLSLDPAAPDYAVSRILDAYPTPTLVTARELRAAPSGNAVPALGATPFVSQPVIFTVHTGMITYPMASFAKLVLRSPRLRAVPKYRHKAVEYLKAAREAAAIHDDEWRQTEDGHGYFVWNKGTPLAYDGTEQPTNQSLALGQTYAELAAATGDPFYADRARRMARTFLREVRADADDAYVWSYWPAFGRTYNGFAKADGVSEFTPSGGPARQIEDLSHGAIDVEFAAAVFRNRLFYKGVDLARFARTYSKNLVAPPGADGIATAYQRVDGTGSTTTAGQYLQAPRWMAVAQWDETVFTHSRAIYDGRAVQPQLGSYLGSVAYLNWHARRGS
ncbi:hypothetical protein [Nonomuraea endophytica]|uniref:Tat pathway signal sequence domain protein n=1 Tax=Nonomuraea endophytica TaxID=714136 RepID=A0A7W8EDT7_9ACTN|nr:hypothetical protein [Nonomuraea endophytica]MBB5075728.1 hypothetical protein [Nonomuraea endophytica]